MRRDPETFEGIRRQYTSGIGKRWDADGWRDLRSLTLRDTISRKRREKEFYEAAELLLSGTGPGAVVYLPSANRQHSTAVFQDVNERGGAGASIIGADLVAELVAEAADERDWPAAYFDCWSLNGPAPPGTVKLKSRLSREDVRRLTDGGASPLPLACNALDPPLADGSVDAIYDRLGALWHSVDCQESSTGQQLASFYRILSPGGVLMVDAGDKGFFSVPSTHEKMNLLGKIAYGFTPFPEEGRWSCGDKYDFEASPVELRPGGRYVLARKSSQEEKG